MKYTVSDFALKIRNQYPGDYDDLSDSRLVELWLKKYPSDARKIKLDKGYSSNIGSSVNLKSYYKYIVIGLFLVVAAITNPNENKHKMEVEKVYHHYIMQLLKNNDNDSVNDNSLFEVLGEIYTNAQISLIEQEFADENIISKNYLFFSTTVYTRDSDEVVGIGLFGQVLLREQFKHEIKTYLENK